MTQRLMPSPSARFGGSPRRPRDQVRLIGPVGTAGAGGTSPGAHLPLLLVVTFGGLLSPCETISVVRVQAPSLTVLML